MTEADLMNVLGNAQVLCSSKGDAIINEAKKNVDSSYGTVYESKTKDMPINIDSSSNIKKPKDSKLNFIYEEMQQNPIHVKPIDQSGMPSLDNVDLSKLTGSKYAQQIEEQVKPQQQMYAPPTVGVDYSIIRAIVNECIENKITSKLNEGKLDNILLKGGKITLTDNKGNIYEAKLEKVGNLND